MLWTDARVLADGAVMTDSRVTHLWDEGRQASQWFARNVDGYEGFAWDVYYLYGPEAQWEDVPYPLLGAGGTVYSLRNSLTSQVTSILQE
jgi:hypothetical protein